MYFYSMKKQPTYEELLQENKKLRTENSRKDERIAYLERMLPQIRNPTKVSERCGPNRQECDFSSSD